MAIIRVLVLCWMFQDLCQALPPPLDITQLNATEPQCMKHLNTLRQGFHSGELWAETILDSGVRTPVGVFSQTGIQFGSFDECLSLSAPFDTQFCLLDVSPVKNGSSWSFMKWGVCLPASCKTWDLQTTVQKYMDSRHSEGEAVKVLVLPELCTSKETVSSLMTTGDIAFCVVMGVVVLIVTISTIYDTKMTPNSCDLSTPKTFTQCLSARHSWYTLLRVEAHDSINLEPFYGLHLFAIFFIVLGHRYGAHVMFMTLINFSGIQNVFSYPWYSIWVSHMDLFVDMFFFMSSFLLAVIYSTALDTHFISPLNMYIKRIFRVLPGYGTVLVFYATLLRHIDSGPLWNLFMDGEKTNCKQYWWTNILFINNYVEKDHICLPQSWYLSCDFQLFLMGTLLVLLLHKNYHTGLIVSTVIFVASTLMAFFGTYLYNRPAMMVFNKEFWTNPRNNDMFSSVYTQAHYRLTSYLPGLLTGCYVHRRKVKAISKKSTFTLQVVGLATCLVVYWSGSLFYDETIQLSQLVDALYAAFFHSVFGLGLALLAISFTLGHPTPLSNILSWRGFIPLSKLTYCVYLIHFILPFVWLASSRTPSYLNTIELLSWTIADLLISLIMAFLLAITVEIPVKNILTYYTTTDSSTENHALNECNVKTSGINNVIS